MDYMGKKKTHTKKGKKLTENITVSEKDIYKQNRRFLRLSYLLMFGIDSIIKSSVSGIIYSSGLPGALNAVIESGCSLGFYIITTPAISGFMIGCTNALQGKTLDYKGLFKFYMPRHWIKLSIFSIILGFIPQQIIKCLPFNTAIISFLYVVVISYFILLAGCLLATEPNIGITELVSKSMMNFTSNFWFLVKITFCGFFIFLAATILLIFICVPFYINGFITTSNMYHFRYAYISVYMLANTIIMPKYYLTLASCVVKYDKFGKLCEKYEGTL
jgi:hypothetical protein